MIPQSPFYIPGSFNNDFWLELRKLITTLQDQGQLSALKIYEGKGEAGELTTQQSGISPTLGPLSSPSTKTSSSFIVTTPIDLRESFWKFFRNSATVTNFKKRSFAIERYLASLTQAVEVVRASPLSTLSSLSAKLMDTKFDPKQSLVSQIQAQKKASDQEIMREMDSRLNDLTKIVRGQNENRDVDMDMSQTLEFMHGLLMRYTNLNLLETMTRATQRRRELYFQKYTTTSKHNLSEWRDTKRSLINSLESKFNKSLIKLNMRMPQVMLLSNICPEQLVQAELLLTSCANTENLMTLARLRLENCQLMMNEVNRNLQNKRSSDT